jgi:hypothetical protein
VREPFSVSLLDTDFSVGLYVPAAFKNTDFDNDGRVGFTYDRFLFWTLGAGMKLGAFGAAVLGDFERYDLSPNANPNDPSVSATVGRLHAVGGWSFFRGQLAIGGGARIVSLAFDASNNRVGAATQGAANVLGLSGAAPEVGVLVRPDWEPWRIGATYRMAVEGSGRGQGIVIGADGVERAAGLVVPRAARLPWEVEVGFALQMGPRPLNPSWIDPVEHERLLARDVEAARAERHGQQDAELAAIPEGEARERRAGELARAEERATRAEEERLARGADVLWRERRARYWNWPRERITLLGELLITGPSDDAVSLESFFAQKLAPSGRHTTVTPRLGLEGEPVPGRLQARFGTYIEPSRYEGRPSRQHFTFGFDLRLGPWDMFGITRDQIWRLTGATDLSPRYQNLGLSVGAWH